MPLTGALSYSFAPDSPIRDSLSVPISYISARRKQRSLDIDGGNTVYHCKALSVRRLSFRNLTEVDVFASFPHDRSKISRSGQQLCRSLRESRVTDQGRL